MIEHFGKSFLDILSLKTSFFEDNDALLERALRHAAFYRAQPARTACKVCGGPLPTEALIEKNGIGYARCSTCKHLNGLHEDTDEFALEVYANRGGTDYASVYGSADRTAYETRREAIYTPKVDFLFDVLRASGEDPASLSVADMGAGAGYFVNALRHRGTTEVAGYELGEALVSLGNWMMEDQPIRKVELPDVVRLTAEVDVDLLSFIGVFEHLQDLRGVLAAVRENGSARYLYTCVPMYSPTVFNEAAFPNVMPRHLTGGHTHLFTHSSLAHLEAEFGLERLGAWWFGTDAMDYYRSVSVTTAAVSPDGEGPEAWSELFAPLVDDVQLAIDKHRASSQVHLVYRCT